MTAPPRIAIIGGGPSGLALLNVLARHNVAATLYERDASATARSLMGGTLDLHVESGQAAMHGAGVWDAFVKHWRPEGEAFTVWNKKGEMTVEKKLPPTGTPPARPEIDRRDLRKILVEAAPAGSIKWDHTFVSAAPVPGTHEWEVTFANGHKTTVDLLVGADGGRSRVRPLVSDAQITYTGIKVIETYFNAAAHPELAARVGPGSIMCFGDGKMLAGQANSDGRVRAYGFFAAPESFVLPADPEAALAVAVEQFADWAPWQRAMFEAADRNAIFLRSEYVLPVGHTWPHRRGVTLVGDAMNLMPTAGEGANIALWDALELGLAIGGTDVDKGLDALDAAVEQYEKKMCEIAGKAAEESREGQKDLLDNGCASKLWDYFKQPAVEGAEQ